MRIMSYNIHFKEKEDKLERSWEIRKTKIASILQMHQVDIAGIQEPLQEQINDLESLLDQYDWCSIKLDQDGPCNAIFYLKDKFELEKTSSFFLSKRPMHPEKDWNAKYTRGVVWAKLREKKTNKSFYFFCTHFDYHSLLARNQSVKLLRKKVKEIADAQSFIITGDFNLFPEMRGDETYKLFLEKTHGAIFIEAQKASNTPHEGPTGTWCDFIEKPNPNVKPDYIFVSPDIQVLSHAILVDNFDGYYPSDHLPILAEISL